MLDFSYDEKNHVKIYDFRSDLHAVKNMKNSFFLLVIRIAIFEFPDHLQLFRNQNLMSKDNFGPQKDDIFEIFENLNFGPQSAGKCEK